MKYVLHHVNLPFNYAILNVMILQN